MKYIGKSNEKRPPVGKREVFSSRGLNKIERIISFQIPKSIIDNFEEYDRIGSTIILVKKRKRKNVKNKF